MKKYLSENQVKEIIIQYGKTWDEFIDFMLGQTHAIDENRKPYYYKLDVSRFIGDDIFYLVDYKGKFTIVMDVFVDTPMQDYVGFITKKQLLDQLEIRKTFADIYGVPVYIGSNISINKLLGYDIENYE